VVHSDGESSTPLSRTAAMNLRRISDALVVATLGLLVLAPTFDELVRDAESRGPRENEMREGAAFPRLPGNVRGWAALPHEIERWYGDFLGLRDVLIRWHSLTSLFVFHCIPSTEAELGRDGWIFFTGGRSRGIARGGTPLSLADLESWREALEAQRDAVESLGARYLLALAPNKETTYPEKLPDRMDPIGPARLDQLLAHLRRHSDIEFVDLRDALIEAKRSDRVGDWTYFPQGTHWYGRGALAAYRAIVAALKPHFPGLEPLKDDELDARQYGQDSWAQRMYVFDHFPQDCLAFVPRTPRAHVVHESPGWSGGERVTAVDDERLPRAVFLHDSMLAYFEPLMAEHFQSSAFLWTNHFDVARIAAAKPDVVVVTHVERVLAHDRPLEYRPINDEGAAERGLARAEIAIFELATAQSGDLVAHHTLELTARGGRTELRVHGRSGYVEVPSVALHEGATVYAQMDVETKESTFVALAHRAVDEPEYKRASMSVYDLQPGRRKVSWRLVVPRGERVFALVAGRTTTPIVMHGLSIRAVRDR